MADAKDAPVPSGATPSQGPGDAKAEVTGNPNANVPGKPETQGGPDKNPPPGSMNNPIPQQIPKGNTPQHKVTEFAGNPGGSFQATGDFGDTPGTVTADGQPVQVARWSANSIKGTLPASYKRGGTVQIKTASGHTIDHKY